MVAATEKPESAGEQLEQARDGAEWGRGEVARLWVRGIETGTMGWPAQSSAAARARALRDASVRKEKKGKEGMRSFQCSREDKAVLRRRGRGAIADAWRRRRVAGRGMGVGRHSAEHRRTSVHSFDDF